MINNAGSSGYQVQVELTLQPCGNDVHVQQTQEAAAEAVAQCHGSFRVKGKGSVVHPQLFQRILQCRVVRTIRRINAAIHHGRYVTVAGKWFFGRTCSIRDGIAYTGITHILNGSSHVANIAGQKTLARLIPGCKGAYFHNIEFAAGCHEPHPHAGFQAALLDTNEADGATIIVIESVKNQCLQGRLFIACGGRNKLDDGLQHIAHIQACFRGNARSLRRIETDNFLDFIPHFLRLSGRQINFVDYRDDFQVMIQCHITIGQGLGFNTLRSVDHQQGTFAGSQCTADFISKVNMTGGIDQIQGIGFSILRFVLHAYSLALNGDATFALQLHAVKNLVDHLSLLEDAGHFQNAICQSGLAVINMGNDAKIANLTQSIVCQK